VEAPDRCGVRLQPRHRRADDVRIPRRLVLSLLSALILAFPAAAFDAELGE
jgi:hypothetical protein